MKVTVLKRPKESDERLIARFNKEVQKSRKIQKIRDTRYNKKKPTRRLQKNSAIMREMYREKREKNKFY